MKLNCENAAKIYESKFPGLKLGRNTERFLVEPGGERSGRLPKCGHTSKGNRDGRSILAMLLD